MITDIPIIIFPFLVISLQLSTDVRISSCNKCAQSLCVKSICPGYLRVKKISPQVLRYIGCNAELNVFWGSGSHRNSPVRLRATLILAQYSLCFWQMRLTSSWNETQKVTVEEKRRRGKKAARPRKWEEVGGTCLSASLMTYIVKADKKCTLIF